MVSGSAPAVQLLSSHSLKRWSSSSFLIGPFNWPPASRTGANYSSRFLSFELRVCAACVKAAVLKLLISFHFSFMLSCIFLLQTILFKNVPGRQVSQGWLPLSFRKSYIPFILILFPEKETWHSPAAVRKVVPEPSGTEIKEPRGEKCWSLQRW